MHLREYTCAATQSRPSESETRPKRRHHAQPATAPNLVTNQGSYSTSSGKAIQLGEKLYALKSREGQHASRPQVQLSHPSACDSQLANWNWTGDDAGRDSRDFRRLFATRKSSFPRSRGDQLMPRTLPDAKPQTGRATRSVAIPPAWYIPGPNCFIWRAPWW